MSIHPLGRPVDRTPSLDLSTRGGQPPVAGPVTFSASTTLIAADIAAFGDPRRDDHAQLHLRRRLYEQLAEAFAMTGLPLDYCYHEDRGDGVLIVAPPEISPVLLLDPLAHHLHAVLRRENRLASETGRLRLRAAAHNGLVHRDAHGLAGRPVTHLFRLLEARAFKRALAGAGTDLGLIVSDRLFGEAAGRGGFLDPDGYREILAACKETRARAWLWLPPGTPHAA